MPLQIVRNDITRMRVDAIVNAANSTLLGGGGVDGCIHQAAGPQLLEACRALGGCQTGSAKVTPGYGLPCKIVIHAVGPRWQGGRCGEREKLASCYRTSLALARAHGCRTVAFPLISSGAYGYPKAEALRVAVGVIGDFLLENDMLVYLVIFDRKAYQIGEKLFSDIAAYIDDRYADAHAERADMCMRRVQMAMEHEAMQQATAPQMAPSASLDDALARMDESFSEMLLRKIGEKGMTDAQCYKRANIDRKLFSKIRTASAISICPMGSKASSSSCSSVTMPSASGQFSCRMPSRMLRCGVMCVLMAANGIARCSAGITLPVISPE